MTGKLKIWIALFAALLLLAGCAMPAASGAASSGADASDSSLPDEGEGAPARGEEAEPWWSDDFKQREFWEFFSPYGYSNNFAANMNFLVDGSEALQDRENSRSMNFLMTRYLYWLDEKNGTLMDYDPASGQVVYPVARLEQLSQEMFGFAYDFSHALTLSETRQKGYITQLYTENWSTVANIVDDSLDYADGEIRVQVDFWLTPNNGSYPKPLETREFVFTFHPDSVLCPYQLVSVSASGGLLRGAKDIAAPKTAGVTMPDSELIRPLEAVVYASGGLNLRKGPGSDTGSVLLIPDNSWVQVLGCQAADEDFAWLYVDYNGEQGWVSREYVYQYYY